MSFGLQISAKAVSPAILFTNYTYSPPRLSNRLETLKAKNRRRRNEPMKTIEPLQPPFLPRISNSGKRSEFQVGLQNLGL
jgi:hypothetical protein